MNLAQGDCYQGLFVDFRKKYPRYGWPKHISMWKDGRHVWLHEFAELRAAGEKLFLDRMLPRDIREESRRLWREVHDELDIKEREIAALDFRSLSERDFITQWDEFEALIQRFWMYSCLPELSNYGSVEYLQKQLAPYVPSGEIAPVLEILTAPEEPSFFQEEEIELSETGDIAAHREKYFWIHNGYDHIEAMPAAFFEKRKRDLSPGTRREFEKKVEETRRRKREVCERYKLPGEIVRIAEAIIDGINWQDARKKDIWVYLHYRDLLIEEAARRLILDKEKLLPLFCREISDLLKGKELDFPMEPRDSYGFFIDGQGSIEMFGADTARKYWEAYVDVKVEREQKEFRGIVACKGRGSVRGAARIVTDPRSATGFHDGDILVTTMTSPEYVFLMKKAGAVVTDTGGLTSHAAIVSRELGVPCLVGTKVATKVLKDGDMVEVDAANCVVRKL